jgi:hypothetical protein
MDRTLFRERIRFLNQEERDWLIKRIRELRKGKQWINYTGGQFKYKISEGTSGGVPCYTFTFYSTTNGNPSHVIHLAQEFIRKFHDDWIFYLTVANIPEDGEVDSSAYVVSKDDFKQIHLEHWLRRTIGKLKKKIEAEEQAIKENLT